MKHIALVIGLILLSSIAHAEQATLIFAPSSSELFIAGGIPTSNTSSEGYISSFILKTVAPNLFVHTNHNTDVLPGPLRSITAQTTEISATSFSVAVDSEQLIGIGAVVPTSVGDLDGLRSFFGEVTLLSGVAAPLPPRYVATPGSGEIRELLLAEASVGVCDFDNSGRCDVGDIDQLSGSFDLLDGVGVTNTSPDKKFDLNHDEIIDIQDLHVFRAMAGILNGDGDPAERYIIGDANLDGTVNVKDFLGVSGNFNNGPAAGEVGIAWSRGDFNQDKKVDVRDFLVLSRSYNDSISLAPLAVEAQAVSAVVPEPGHHLALMIAGLFLGLARRARDGAAGRRIG